MLKITIKEDFRTFKAGTVYDFSILDKLYSMTIVGDNGVGKSSLFHALRGTINSSKTSSLYESDFEKLTNYVNIEHNYDAVFFLDADKDNGNDMMNAYDAVSYIESGGFQTKNLSHGQTSLTHLTRFIQNNESKIIPGKTLVILDEADNGFSLSNMSKFQNVITNLMYKYKCHVIAITHNPFLIASMLICFDIGKNDIIVSDDYIKQVTGFSLTKVKDNVLKNEKKSNE